jgi:cytochrome b subunit of formate dehydrogenase
VKRSDLGIVWLHWMMVVAILAASASGLCLWDKRLLPWMAFVFIPGNIGVIHIGLSVAVVAILLAYLWYQRHKNSLGHLSLWRKETDRWKRAAVWLYWSLLAVIAVETITGILLTKLINPDVLAKVFSIERSRLAAAHLYPVAFILVFPFAHVTIHWLDGRWSKLLSIFRPKVFPRRPSRLDRIAKLRAENIRLKKERSDVAR